MAEALLVIKIDSEGNLTVVKQAKSEVENLGQTSDRTAKGGLDMLAAKAQLVAAGLIAIKAAHEAVEIVQLGAQSLAASQRLEAFGGSAGRAQEMLDALRSSTDYTIDRMTATAHASRLMQMEMVRNRSEMELTGAVVSKLGDQTQSIESRMQTWTMLLANQSTLRLDTFGLSVERVEARMALLESQGYSTEEAFRTAVYDEGAMALETLGDTSESLSTKFAILEAGADTIKQSFAEGVAVAFAETLGPGTELAETLERIALAARTVGEVGFTTFMSIMTGYGQDFYAKFRGREKNPEIERFERFQAAQKEVVVSLEDTSLAQLEAAKAAEEHAKALDRQIDIAMQVTQIERRRSEAYASLNERERDLAVRHQERLNEIYRQGETSRTEIVQKEYQARLGALSEQFAREEEAYQAQRAAERYGRELQGIEREHQERVQEIRDQYRETERQREDQHYSEALDALEESQRERMRILRGESAEGGFESRREEIAREHEDRMAGLYSKAARERERERYAEERGQIDQEEAEYDLLQQFEREKEDLEGQHADNVQDIRDREIQEQLLLEEGRYREERAMAHDRERERRQELNRRQDMERREAEARRQIEAWYQAEMAEIQRQQMAERIAQANQDYARELEQLSQSRASIETTYNEAMSRLVMREMEGNAERRLAYAQANNLIIDDTMQWQEQMNRILNATVQYSMEMWQKIFEMEQHTPGYYARDVPRGEERPRYQHGTSFHPGGAAIIGEGDTRGEMVVLPRGTQVFDAPTTEGMMGGSTGQTLIINNYFGRDAVRSERDIWEISRDQEMMFRRRGVRTFSTT